MLILVKASNLPVTKVKQFLHSKPSSTKFTQATCKFKITKALARLKKEICCMDFIYVDKLATGNDGLKYLLVRQDLFDRTVGARGRNMITIKDRPKNIWVDKGTEFPAEFILKYFAKLKDYKFTLKWVRLRVHLQNVQYNPWKLYFTVRWKIMDKYTHNLSQFVITLHSRKIIAR